MKDPGNEVDQGLETCYRCVLHARADSWAYK